MVERPIRKAIEQTTKQATQNARALCPWLPNPHRCECGAWCDADIEFVRSQAIRMRVWQCSECDRSYYRTRD